MSTTDSINGICVYCGAVGKVHEPRCPSSSKLRPEETGLPPYMRKPQPIESQTTEDDDTSDSDEE